MAEIVSFNDRRNKAAADALTEFSKKLDAALKFGLSAQHVTGVEVAGVMAHRLGTFLTLFSGSRMELVNAMATIVAKEAFREPVSVVDTPK